VRIHRFECSFYVFNEDGRELIKELDNSFGKPKVEKGLELGVTMGVLFSKLGIGL
jgi:hypothetical protein